MLKRSSIGSAPSHVFYVELTRWLTVLGLGVLPSCVPFRAPRCDLPGLPRLLRGVTRLRALVLTVSLRGFGVLCPCSLRRCVISRTNNVWWVCTFLGPTPGRCVLYVFFFNCLLVNQHSFRNEALRGKKMVLEICMCAVLCLYFLHHVVRSNEQHFGSAFLKKKMVFGLLDT